MVNYIIDLKPSLDLLITLLAHIKKPPTYRQLRHQLVHALMFVLRRSGVSQTTNILHHNSYLPA